MPELPEVETTRRGIAPYLEGKTVQKLIVRQRKLRWPIASKLTSTLPGQALKEITRRDKYLLLHLDAGTLILHLGMSGSLRILPPSVAPGRHDHFDLVFDSETCLRLRDPRRFGALLWTQKPPLLHPLLQHLGPEPLSDAFCGSFLYRLSKNRRTPVKTLIMNSRVVVGVGNIYASESLFRAGIHPLRACHRISELRYIDLAQRIKTVLEEAIAQGGTTLRDFHKNDGQPGYFTQQLRVYGRTGEPCLQCGQPIRQQTTIRQRSSFYCSYCQR